MTILVGYASKHGSTESTATSVAQRLREAGHVVELRRLDRIDSLDGYDRLVIGCPVYASRWYGPGVRFLKRHERALRRHSERLWVFTVGGGPTIPAGANDVVAPFAPVEHGYLRGRIDRGELNIIERTMIRAARAPYGDFTDPSAVEAFADRISESR